MRLYTKYLRIRKSQLSGRGVYTSCFIPKHRFVTIYSGERKHINQVNVYNPYCVKISKNYVIVGNKCIAGVMNDAKGPCQKPNCKNNVMLLKVGRHVFVYSLKNIPKEDELFVSYGKEYWNACKK